MNDWHQSQRGYFAGALYDQMKENRDIYLLVGDLGFGMFDKIRDDFPDRFINCGASEQAMVGIAVGLALKGKKPFCYTITSFFMRAAETITLYLGNEQIGVRLVGSGRNGDYKHDGESHHARHIQKFFRNTDLVEYCPIAKENIPEMVKNMVENDVPAFISLRR